MLTINLATSLLQTFIVLVTSLPSCCLPGKRVRSLPKEEAIDNSFSHEADRSYAHFFASFTAMTVTRCSTLNGKFSATHVYHQFPRRTRRVTTGVSRDGEKRGRNGGGGKKRKKKQNLENSRSTFSAHFRFLPITSILPIDTEFTKREPTPSVLDPRPTPKSSTYPPPFSS